MFAGTNGAIKGVLNGQVGLGKKDPTPEDRFSDGAGFKSNCKSWNAYGGLSNAVKRQTGKDLGTGAPTQNEGRLPYCNVKEARPNVQPL